MSKWFKKKINKNTKAIIFVHSFGNPSGFLEIKKISQKYKIPIIEDAACAIGSKIKSDYVGEKSDLACFSFHQKKILNTGEGGIITSSNSSLYKKILLKSNLGAVNKKRVLLRLFFYNNFIIFLTEFLSTFIVW